MMLLKIKGIDEKQLQNNIERVMNIACVAFRRGVIPSTLDMVDPERTGRYWYKKEDGSVYELYPMVNDHKAFVRSKGENYIVVNFHSRYDGAGFPQATALSNLILALFPEYEAELVKQLD